MDKCESCRKEIDYEPISLSADPYSIGLCYECLPDDIKRKYDKFCESLTKVESPDVKKD